MGCLGRKHLVALRPYLLALFDLHPTLDFGESILDIGVSIDESAFYITKDPQLLEKIHTICCRELGKYILFNKNPVLRFVKEKKGIYVVCNLDREAPFVQILQAVQEFCRTVSSLGFDA